MISNSHYKTSGKSYTKILNKAVKDKLEKCIKYIGSSIIICSVNFVVLVLYIFKKSSGPRICIVKNTSFGMIMYANRFPLNTNQGNNSNNGNVISDKVWRYHGKNIFYNVHNFATSKWRRHNFMFNFGLKILIKYISLDNLDEVLKLLNF